MGAAEVWRVLWKCEGYYRGVWVLWRFEVMKKGPRESFAPGPSVSFGLPLHAEDIFMDLRLNQNMDAPCERPIPIYFVGGMFLVFLTHLTNCGLEGLPRSQGWLLTGWPNCKSFMG